MTDIYNIEDYGAKADFIELGDGSITAGQNILTSLTAPFSAADVGKIMLVNGAGSNGIGGVVLITKIDAYISPTQVTLHDVAAHTVSGARFQFATDSTPGINAAFSAAKVTGGAVRANFAGRYGVTHINWTNPTRPVSIEGIGGTTYWGTRFEPMADGGAVFDATGHDAFHMTEIMIGGSNAQLVLPDYGILLANSTEHVVSVPIFDLGGTDGFFRIASAYFDRVFGGTAKPSTSFGNYFQTGPAGKSYSVVMTGSNVFNATSAFATITERAATRTSDRVFWNWLFDRTEFHNFSPNVAVQPSNSYTIYMDGVHDTTFVGGIIGNSWVSPIFFGPDCVGNTWMGVEFFPDDACGFSYVFSGDANSNYTAFINNNPVYHSLLHPMTMANLTIIGRS